MLFYASIYSQKNNFITTIYIIIIILYLLKILSVTSMQLFEESIQLVYYTVHSRSLDWVMFNT